jgi:hypothetical protein
MGKIGKMGRVSGISGFSAARTRIPDEPPQKSRPGGGPGLPRSVPEKEEKPARSNCAPSMQGRLKCRSGRRRPTIVALSTRPNASRPMPILEYTILFPVRPAGPGGSFLRRVCRRPLPRGGPVGTLVSCRARWGVSGALTPACRDDPQSAIAGPNSPPRVLPGRITRLVDGIEGWVLATWRRESGQARKGAAISALAACARGAWLEPLQHLGPWRSDSTRSARHFFLASQGRPSPVSGADREFDRDT